MLWTCLDLLLNKASMLIAVLRNGFPQNAFNKNLIFLLLLSVLLCCEAYETSCDLSQMSDAHSAFDRAKSEACKKEIADIACSFNNYSLFDYETIYKPTYNKLTENTLVSCIDPIEVNDLLQRINISHLYPFKSIKNTNYCLSRCRTFQSKYAVYDRTEQNCFCITQLSPENEAYFVSFTCEKSEKDGSLIEFYRLGLIGSRIQIFEIYLNSIF
jgi:hypothetical protein